MTDPIGTAQERELIDRLRLTPDCDVRALSDNCVEAADALQSRIAEVERLREALQEFATRWNESDTTNDDEVAAYMLAIPEMIERASAALSQSCEMRQSMDGISGSRKPDPSFTGSGPSGFDPGRALAQIAYVAGELHAVREAGFTEHALQFPRSREGLVALCAFNGIKPEQAPRGWRYWPNAAMKKSWERVIAALKEDA